jgi:hypothetical protein
MQARHFPGPWSVVDIPGGYRVQDATGHPLSYFYSWDDPAAAHQSDVLRSPPGRACRSPGAGTGWRCGGRRCWSRIKSAFGKCFTLAN